MNKLQKKRLYFVVLFIIGISIAAGLILYALKQNINVFMTPSQFAAINTPTDYQFRLGGMVKPNSIHYDNKDVSVEFVVTDSKHDLTVRYNGVLPDLFREGKGVIAEGSVNASGVFIATQVLAKHDENYMPRTVYQTIRQSVNKT